MNTTTARETVAIFAVTFLICCVAVARVANLDHFFNSSSMQSGDTVFEAMLFMMIAWPMLGTLACVLIHLSRRFGSKAKLSS